MSAPDNSYWSIEDCAWVRSPARSVELPEPRAAEQLDADDATHGGVAGAPTRYESVSDLTV
jgi:hypothetical protein